MKDNSNEDISVSFIIKPVHQDNKGKDANDEVQTIKQSLLHYISMVITFDTPQEGNARQPSKQQRA